VKISTFETLGSGLAKVVVGGMGLEASTLLIGFAALAMIYDGSLLVGLLWRLDL